MTRRVIGAIDLGTTKVATAVALVYDTNIRVLSIASEPCSGMRWGIIEDREEVLNKTRAAWVRAVRMAGIRPTHVLMSITSEETEFFPTRGMVKVTSGKITKLDIHTALELASSTRIGEGKRMIDLIPRYYVLDQREEYRTYRPPIGYVAGQLEVHAYMVLLPENLLANYELLAKELGVKIERFILQSVASAYAVSRELEREEGVMVVDIGGGTADMAFFQDGRLAGGGSKAGIGGRTIITALSQNLGIPLVEAERLLKEVDLSLDYVNEYYKVSRSTGYVEIDLNEVQSIMLNYVEYFYKLIIEWLRRIYQTKRKVLLPPRGIILTGGMANLKGIISEKVIKHMENKLGIQLPISIGEIAPIEGVSEEYLTPPYATLLGMLVTTNYQKVEVVPSGGIFSKIVRWLFG